MTDFAVGDKVRLKGRLTPVPAGATGTIIGIRQSGGWSIRVDFSPHHDNVLVNPWEIDLMNENDILDKGLERLLDEHFGEPDDEYPDFWDDDPDDDMADWERELLNPKPTPLVELKLDDLPDGYYPPDDWDMVANPPHYQQYPFGEVIDITKHLGFLDGNVIKYVLRAPFKGSEIEDLKKAAQYLAWLIEKREEES